MIVVLRIGHRLGRDARISTHCGLVSRTFGAEKIIYTGDHDSQLLQSVNKMSAQWGGSFEALYEKNWTNTVQYYKRNRFLIVHLTMYGEPIQRKMRYVRKSKNILVIVGGEKVPGEVYQMADYNISVTQQPHSEIAALSIFLHEYLSGKELNKKFSKAKIKVVPQKAGKRVVRNE